MTKPEPTRKRYEQVAEALLAEIRGGTLAVGATLPGELELVERFGVSRHTIREALRRLEGLGSLIRVVGRCGVGWRGSLTTRRRLITDVADEARGCVSWSKSERSNCGNGGIVMMLQTNSGSAKNWPNSCAACSRNSRRNSASRRLK